MKKIILILLIIGVLVTLVEGANNKVLPCLITLNSENINPESVEFSDKTGFIVSSLNPSNDVVGHIYQVSETGVVTSYVSDSRLLQTRGLSFGKKSLSKNMAIVSCLRPDNPAATKRGGVAVISVGATQGEIVRYIDVTNVPTPTNSRFQDDLAIDSGTGDIYLTEAKGGWIYKIPAEGNGAPFVWSYSPVWAPTTEPTGLNGIDYFDGKNYLLGCHQGNNASSNFIYKVLFSDPNNPRLVKLKGDTGACDGLNYANSDKVVIMSGNRVDTVYQIISNDDWETATVVRQGAALGFSSSTIVASDNAYHTLANSNFDAPTPVYIQKMDMFCTGLDPKVCKTGELWVPKSNGNGNDQNMQQVIDQLLEANSATTLSSFLF